MTRYKPVIKPGQTPSDTDLNKAETVAIERLYEAIAARNRIKIPGDPNGSGDDLLQAERILHDTDDIAIAIRYTVAKALKSLPVEQRSHENMIQAMQEYFMPIEEACREEARRRISAETGAEAEKTRKRQQTKEADRKIAMLFLADTLGISAQWTAVYTAIDSKLKERGLAA